MENGLSVGIDDSSNIGAAPARKIVEQPIGAHLQIHRTGNIGGEASDVAGGRVQLPNPTTAGVGKEVTAPVTCGKLVDRWSVEGAASDGVSGGGRGTVTVLKNRILKLRICWIARALARRPAIVRTGAAFVDFLHGTFAHVIDEHPASDIVDGEGEWIAQSQCPDGAVLSAGHVEKRVGYGNRTVPVNAQNFAQTIVQSLSIGWRGVLSDRHIKQTVRAEVNGSRVVAGGAEILEIENRPLTALSSEIAIRCKTADPVMKAGYRGR